MAVYNFSCGSIRAGYKPGSPPVFRLVTPPPSFGSAPRPKIRGLSANGSKYDCQRFVSTFKFPPSLWLILVGGEEKTFRTNLSAVFTGYPDVDEYYARFPSFRSFLRISREHMS